METEKPETGAEKETSNDENPDGGVGRTLDDTRLVGVKGTHPGADRVGHIVGTVSDGHDHGTGDLGVCPQMLDAVVITDGASMRSGERLGGMGDTVAGHTLQQEIFSVRHEAERVEGR